MPEYDLIITAAPAPEGEEPCIRINGRRFVCDEEPQSAYSGHFPDLPGCSATGGDFLELLKSAAKSMDLWLQEEEKLLSK